jgi:acid phosphatase (class A)
LALGLALTAAAAARTDELARLGGMPGYLAAGEQPDVVALIGPPPTDRSGAKLGDVATYRATRALQGSPRWALAQRDATFGPGPMMAAYSCALGIQVDAHDAPALSHLLSRVVGDTETAEDPLKHAYKRPRPFVDNPGAICVPADPWLAKSYSYPSGHSIYSWTVALILQALTPDRSAQILSRARSYGESRVVCGVHYPTDVEAGRFVGTAVFGALQSEAAFQSDLAAARRELAALRAGPPHAPDAAECKIEADAAARPIW